MNSKSILTKTILTLCVSALLMLQPAFAQIGKTKKTMPPEQIEAFLKEAQMKGWQITVRTKGLSYSGKPNILRDGAEVGLADPHYFYGIGACGVQKPTATYAIVKLSDIASVEKRNLPLHFLRSAGEVSLSSTGLPIYAIFGVAILLNKH